jgi:diguanylate cyclase (GGDEF)-like protein
MVRAHPGPYTYFVLLTAFGDRNHALEGMQAGADDYLAKTLDVDDLSLRLIAAERVTALHKRLAEQDARLRALAEVDQLTQLANRHKSTEVLTHYLALATRQQLPLSLAVVDVDHFKHVNDRFGHATGDEVLRELAQTLRRSFRGEDVVARWGGEEFVVGAFGVGQAEALRRIDALREQVAAERFGGADGTLFSVTISAGVATAPLDARTVQGLYAAADAALYRAKALGRNQVVAAARADARAA